MLYSPPNTTVDPKVLKALLYSNVFRCCLELCPVWYYWLVRKSLGLKKKFFFQISPVVINSETCNKSIQLLKDGYPTYQKWRDFKLLTTSKMRPKHSIYNKISGSSVSISINIQQTTHVGHMGLQSPLNSILLLGWPHSQLIPDPH